MGGYINLHFLEPTEFCFTPHVQHPRRTIKQTTDNTLPQQIMNFSIFTLTVFLATFEHVSATGYYVVARTSGRCSDTAGATSSAGGGYITTQAECDKGAAALGWSDTSSDERANTMSIPGCYLYKNQFSGDELKYNTILDSARSAACGEDGRPCLCTVRCSPGTYQDDTGQTSCKPCLSGQYSAMGASACQTLDANNCPVGMEASGTSTVCDSCPTGKYNDQTGSTCKFCDTPNHVVSKDKTQCVIDQHAPIFVTKASGKCTGITGGNTILSRTKCMEAAEAVGFEVTVVDPKYANNPNTYTKPPGCFTDESDIYGKPNLFLNTPASNVDCDSSDKCLCSIICPPGTFNDGQSSSCSDCPSGELSTRGASSCQYSTSNCPPGTYSSGATCDSCPSGKYNDQAGQTSNAVCKTCVPGSKTNDYQSGCDLCGKGEYQDQSGQPTCKSCDAGTGNDQTGSTSDSACIDCTAGKFNVNSYTGICVDCEKGKYNDQEKQTTDCKRCPDATYSDTLGTSSAENCKNCPVGRWSGQSSGLVMALLVSADDCQMCPKGQYMDEEAHGINAIKVGLNPNLFRCKICGEGTYDPDQGTVTEYGTLTGKGTCDKCPAGRYQENSGSPNPNQHYDCKTCGQNRFQDQPGQSTCRPCKYGTNGKQLKINDDGKNGKELTSYEKKDYHNEDTDCSISGITCLPGESQFDGTCIACEKGTQVSDGQEFCTLCPTGFYQNQLKKENCKKCPTVPDSVCALMPGGVSEQKTESDVLVLPEDDEAEMMAIDLDYNSLSTSNKKLSTECAASRSSILLYQEGMVQGTKTAVYAGLCTLAAVVVLTHRFLPDKAKSLDIMFAKVSDSFFLFFFLAFLHVLSRCLIFFCSLISLLHVSTSGTYC